MATRDIFGSKSSTFGGAFSADDAFMQFPSIVDGNGNTQRAEVPLLLQSASFNYQQQITRLYELTSANIYYVRGRAAGEGNLAQVLGPTKLSQNFLRTYGSVCRAATNTLHFTMLAGCSDADSAATAGFSPQGSWQNSHAFTARYVVLTSVGLQMQAQSMVIQQSIGMTISAMEYEDAAANRIAA